MLRLGDTAILDKSSRQHSWLPDLQSLFSTMHPVLWPTALCAIVGHSYVFQIVISEQTFRIGQLCFQARRLFNPPSVHESVPANVTPGNKEASDGSSDAITESAIPGESTPPLNARTSTPPKNSSAKGKEATGAVHEDHGYALCP